MRRGQCLLRLLLEERNKTIAINTLADLSWSGLFQSQLELSEIEQCRPVSVQTVHRNALEVAGIEGDGRLTRSGPTDGFEATVGD